MSHSRSKVGAMALFFALNFVARDASALAYGDLDAIYAENFDDDTSMSGLVPQTTRSAPAGCSRSI